MNQRLTLCKALIATYARYVRTFGNVKDQWLAIACTVSGYGIQYQNKKQNQGPDHSFKEKKKLIILINEMLAAGHP